MHIGAGCGVLLDAALKVVPRLEDQYYRRVAQHPVAGGGAVVATGHWSMHVCPTEMGMILIRVRPHALVLQSLVCEENRDT